MSKKSEVLAFTMAPELLYSVISSQAGSPAKAFLEGIMNSIDAGATKVFIDVNEKGFSIKDDGKGFESKQTIIDFFGTFGKKHEEGDATYGKFRMGRGQIMSFGENSWRSGQFTMDVDIKNKGLDYKLTEMPDYFDGCEVSVKWYEQVLPSELESIGREFKEMAAWAQIPVIYNGKQFNKIPEQEQWDLVTDDAYFKFRETTGLSVYNLGVLVSTYPNWKFGVGGTVVSKKQLQVNFARNDILLNKCEVWKRLSKHLKKLSIDNVKTKKTRITEDERISMARMLVSGELEPGDAVRDLKLITTAKGNHTTIDALFRATYQAGLIVSFSDDGCQIGETIHQRGMAFVINQTTMYRFDATSPDDFFDAMDKIVENRITELTEGGRYGRDRYSYYMTYAKKLRDAYRPLDQIKEESMGDYIVLDEKELNAKQKLILKVLHGVSYSISRLSYFMDNNTPVRKLMVGRSDVAEAWTDGAKYTVLHEELLDEVWREGFKGMMRVAGVILHEYLHQKSDRGSHVHDQEFYEAFHNITLSYEYFNMGRIIESGVAAMVKEYRDIDKKAPAAMSKAMDVMAITNTTPDLNDLI